METVYFTVLLLLVAVPLAMTLKRPILIFEYPFFMAFAFAAFIVPQGLALIRFPGAVQDGSVVTVLLMSCLCMAACIAGYQMAPGNLAFRWSSWPIDQRKLFHVGVVFIGMGFATTQMLSTTEVQFAQNSGGMTGTGTLLLFFRQLAYPGFAIALFCALRKPSIATIGATLIGLYSPLADVIIGRRENTAMLFLTIVMALYYERKIKPSRLAIIGVLIFSVLAIPSTTEYRRYAGTSNFEGIRNIDMIGAFQRFVSEESILELRNGAAIIESTKETGNYEFGKGYWNHLVFRFVPAQLLGEELKQSLMFNVWDSGRTGTTELGFRFPRGSTMTGMGDSFNQFGLFGCLFFAFMAVLFKGIWRASQVPDALFARLMYAMTFTSGMRAVTHWTLDFLPGLLYFSIFLGVAGVYAAARQPAARTGRALATQVPAGVTR